MRDSAFRPCTRDDLPMLSEWLRNPQVVAWWNGPEEQLALAIEDLDNPAMERWIVPGASMPIGYVQHDPAHEWRVPPHCAHLPGNAGAIHARQRPDCGGEESCIDAGGYSTPVMTRLR